jgi:hypothetical protein
MRGGHAHIDHRLGYLLDRAGMHEPGRAKGVRRSACLWLFASQVYFLRSFVENSFLAQVVSELLRS